jgi:ankyrin repeat protein
VLVLLEHGASVNLRSQTDATALRLALEGDRKDVATVLLRAGAEQ